MISVELGPMYAEIGRMILEKSGSEADGSLMYAEVEEGSVACTIFRKSGDVIVYKECSLDLIEGIYEIWENTPDHEKWSGIQYNIDGKKFGVEMVFKDSFSENEYYMNRSHSVAFKKFGKLEIDFSNP